MTTSDEQHLLKMKEAYIERLRVLELRRARKGLEIEPSVETEISDLEKNIAIIDANLKQVAEIPRASSTRSPLPGNNSSVTKRCPVQIILLDKFEDITAETQIAAIRAFAAIMRIPETEVDLLKLQKGSTIFWLDVPAAAAQRLLDLVRSRDPILAEIGILQVKLLDSAQIASLKATQPKGGFQSALEQIRADASRSLDGIMVDTNNALERIMADTRKTLRQLIAGPQLSSVTSAP